MENERDQIYGDQPSDPHGEYESSSMGDPLFRLIAAKAVDGARAIAQISEQVAVKVRRAVTGDNSEI